MCGERSLSNNNKNINDNDTNDRDNSNGNSCVTFNHYVTATDATHHIRLSTNGNDVSAIFHNRNDNTAVGAGDVAERKRR